MRSTGQNLFYSKYLHKEILDLNFSIQNYYGKRGLVANNERLSSQCTNPKLLDGWFHKLFQAVPLQSVLLAFTD